MYSFTAKSRMGTAILSAGVAAVLATAWGISNASADNLTWNPGASATGGTNGSGTWNSSGIYWYDTTSTTGPVAWTNGDGAYFGTGTGGSSSYTVTLGSSSGTYSTTSLGVTNSGDSYVLDGNGGTITSSGQLLANGNLTLENITLNNTDTSNTDTSAGISQATGATLTIGSGASLDINHIATGVDGSGTINVDSGGYLGSNSGSNSRIQINYGTGTTSGNVFNVNGGTVNMTGTGAIVFLSDAAKGPSSSTGTLNVGAGGTGGSFTTNEIETAGLTGSIAQSGVLNVDSGTVTVTAKPSITTNDGSTTTVNLNGGVLSVVQITEAGSTTTPTGNTIVNFNGGTLQEYNASVGLIANPNSSTYTPTNLNVLNGGAVVDNNGFNVTIYNPLLQGTNADGSLSTGGLKVINSDPSRSGGPGSLTLVGVNTYTGPTEITTGATLQLSGHTAATPNGGATGLASIADTSVLQIDSGGTFMVVHDGVGTQISVGGLNLQGGTIDLGFDGGSVQNLLAGTAASVSGTNTINLSDLSGGTAAVPSGTYTLIADAAGGLTGTFQFANGSDTGTLTVGSNTYTGTLSDSATAVTLTVSAVPEPATLAIFALGGLALLAARRRRNAAI
jgi:fibronectin-binding autotransporter adhesin